jgi:hypothetical protein
MPKLLNAAELHTGPRATVPADPSAWLRWKYASETRRTPLPRGARPAPPSSALAICCAPVAGHPKHRTCPCARCGTTADAMNGPAWTAHYTAGPNHGLAIDLCPACAAAEWPDDAA